MIVSFGTVLIRFGESLFGGLLPLRSSQLSLSPLPPRSRDLLLGGSAHRISPGS